MWDSGKRTCGPFSKESLLTARVSPCRSRRAPDDVLQKPRGRLRSRVAEVGPEHFGIVCVDGAKARRNWLLADC